MPCRPGHVMRSLCAGLCASQYEHARDATEAEPADGQQCAVGDVGDRFGGTGADLVHGRGSRSAAYWWYGVGVRARLPAYGVRDRRGAAVRGESAAHRDLGAGDEGVVGGEEEYYKRGDLLHTPCAAQRCPEDVRLAERGRGGGGHVRLDEAGVDDVHADAAGPPVLCGRLRQTAQCPLAGRVRHQVLGGQRRRRAGFTIGAPGRIGGARCWMPSSGPVTLMAWPWAMS